MSNSGQDMVPFFFAFFFSLGVGFSFVLDSFDNQDKKEMTCIKEEQKIREVKK